MTIDRFWELLSKKHCGEVSSAEIKEFEDILLAHPEWKNTADTLSNLNFQSTVLGDSNEVELAFETHVNRMKRADIEFSHVELNGAETGVPKRTRKLKKWLVPMAVVAAGLTLFFGLENMIGSLQTKNKKQPTLSQVSTKPGSRTQIQLPDGSVVRLNSSSSLTYDKNFGKNIREVNLTGEAFFDVTKDSSHPFIIHTNVIDIKVLGTAFNVRSYPNDANTETSLIRGKVEVTVKNRANEKIYLEPNEKLVVANNNSTPGKTLTDQPERRDNKTDLSPKPIYSVQHLTYYPVDSTIIETSWIDNRLIFQENESFQEVALKMERWYGVQINFKSEKVAGYQMFGSFKNETVTQALDELKLGFKFNYKIDGNIITITQ
jgi:ferric-dicitrate binding protein FerR (iron transport regulator)